MINVKRKNVCLTLFLMNFVFSFLAIRMCMIQPDCWSYQINLLYTCEDFLEPADLLAKYSQFVIRIIENPSEALHLNQSSKQLFQALDDLRSCVNRVKKTRILSSIQSDQCFVFLY